MNIRFDDKRINRIKIANANFKYEIPLIEILPIKKTNKCVIYIPGLNASTSSVEYFNFTAFDDLYLFSYDKMAQGENKNKPTRNYKKFLLEIKFIIDIISKRHPEIEQIYLCGESWGGALAMLYNKLEDKRVFGTFSWNVPYKIVDVSPKKGKDKILSNLKVICSFFGIDTYSKQPPNELLTSNKLLLRIMKVSSEIEFSNLVTIACWKTFKPAWKYIFKNGSNINYKYVQSKDDVMQSEYAVNKISNQQNKLVKLNEGKHILSFEDNANTLFDYLHKFIYN